MLLSSPITKAANVLYLNNMTLLNNVEEVL